MKEFQIDQLIKIAIALSAEKNIDKLLDMILKEAITISNCDAGTVYVREGEQLFFHNTYTGAAGFPDDMSSKKKSMPPLNLSREYVSACAVLDKKKINIADVYESEEYDFSGKQIIPFCSHGGGRFGQSLTAIAKLAPDADIGEGLSVHYSGGSSLSADVSAWLTKNGIEKHQS